MSVSFWFVVAVAVLEGCAGVAYLWQGQWKLAGVWLAVGLANGFMAALDGSK